MEVTKYNFRILGNPVPQGRARVQIKRKKSGQVFPHVHDQQSSINWKQDIKMQIINERSKISHFRILSGALSVTLYFLLKRPESLPKKILHHVKKPDLDNLIKAVKDAMTGLVYEDDKQIINLAATKQYVVPQEPPRILITVIEIQ